MAFSTVLQQVIVIFLLIGVGALAGKIGFIHNESSKDMTRILCYIVSPCVIIKAFQQPFSIDSAFGLLIAFIAALGIHLLATIGLKFVFNRKIVPDPGHRLALRFGATYSNAGFMGIPLLAALLGTQGVFYGTAYLAGFNIFCWTSGIALYNGKTDRKSMLKALVNPNIIAIIIGLFFFLSAVPLPALISTGVSYLYDLNTPLSMLVIGYTFSQIRMGRLFSDPWIWPGTILRNLAVPIIVLIVLQSIGVNKMVLLSSVLMSACPVASYTVLFAKMKDYDTGFPTKLMAISTLLSIVTIPLVLSLVKLSL